MADLFPHIQHDWLEAHVRHGHRRIVARHLMELYERPLRLYLITLPLSKNEREEINDIINSFFLSRLEHDDFMRKWLASGMQLKRWLINALHFHLKELRHNRQRRHEQGCEPLDTLRGHDDPVQDLERDNLNCFVQRSLERTHTHCDAAHMELHFDLFLEHHLHGRSLNELAAENGLTAARAAVMIRTARRHFVTEVRNALRDEGVAEADIPGEVHALADLALGASGLAAHEWRP